MRHQISPVRHLIESILNAFGHGPRSSHFSAVRDPESRMRFAQYMRRTQPSGDPTTARRAAQLLGTNGSVSRGIVRHAPIPDSPVGRRAASLHLFSQPSGLAARRRAEAHPPVSAVQNFLHALRVR